MSNYCAVHLISSSGDHYNYLIEFSSKEDLVEQLREKCWDYCNDNIDCYYLTFNFVDDKSFKLYVISQAGVEL